MKVGDLVTCRPKSEVYFLGAPDSYNISDGLQFRRDEMGVVLQLKMITDVYSCTNLVLVVTAAGHRGWIRSKYLT